MMKSQDLFQEMCKTRKKRNICSSKPQHNSQPKHNDGPSSVYISHLGKNKNKKKKQMHLVFHEIYINKYTRAIITKLTNRTMVAARRFHLAALSTIPNPLLWSISWRNTKIWPSQRITLPSLLIHNRPPIWRHTTRIR